ncbi:MAG: hypothetical protein M3375_08595 [Actinomycetota bacterium]|nr:hypothetical protein [Actinomycetota bacterium]
MPDLSPYPDSDRDPGAAGPGRGPTTATPRWVKVVGAVALVLVVLVAILLLTGGGGHGPGRHTSAGDAGGEKSASGVTAPGRPGGHEPPAGGHRP